MQTVWMVGVNLFHQGQLRQQVNPFPSGAAARLQSVWTGGAAASQCSSVVAGYNQPAPPGAAASGCRQYEWWVQSFPSGAAASGIQLTFRGTASGCSQAGNCIRMQTVWMAGESFPSGATASAVQPVAQARGRITEPGCISNRILSGSCQRLNWQR